MEDSWPSEVCLQWPASNRPRVALAEDRCLPGRVATPMEVAETIAFLASEESSGVSGEAVTVALGGLS